MHIVIRNAGLNDAKSIAELSDHLGYQSEIAGIKKRLIKLLKNTDNLVLVASENDNIVGWIHGFYSLRVESDPFIEIGGLVVNAHYRKQGIGKLLVDQILKWSDEKKCEKVRVRCNRIRKESHLFYRKIGFEIIKEQKVFDISL